ncbi:MAG: penicillin-binding protein 2 [Candidatus Jacksonbacteria bacterium]
MIRKHGRCKKKKNVLPSVGRVDFLIVFFLILGSLVLGQLFRLQVLQHKVFIVQAAKQYNTYNTVSAKRGRIFWQDLSTGESLPLVINRPVYNFYVVPKNIKDTQLTTGLIADILAELLNQNKENILPKLERDEDPYECLSEGLLNQEKDSIVKILSQKNVDKTIYGFEEYFERYYVEDGLSAHLTGFLGFADDGHARQGQYGLEEYFDSILRGRDGLVLGEKDVDGRPIAIGKRAVKEAQDGLDVILTIDKNIQYKACNSLLEYVDQYGAQGGAVIIMNSQNGKLYALCASPSFDPNNYGNESAENFVNSAISLEYEPGSIFKPIVMAAALDTGKITPWTTYLDTGSVVFGNYTIRNFDGKAHGINTMIDVLNKSLNTGAIFAMRSVGPKVFAEYVDAFGFGKLTGIELASEVDGDISPLSQIKEIYAATASFGQGITVTPIQLIAAYAAIARGGTLVKPTIIETIDTKKVDSVKEGNRVMSPETADTLTMMLVSAVQNGYDKKAAVKGYKIAGKTGTAQVPKSDGPGYGEETIHSFIGFGPVGNRSPSFVILIKLDKPTAVRFASDSTAPLFGELIKFLLNYFEIPPDV